MAYCTRADIEQHLPARDLAELTDDVAQDTTVAAIVTDARAAADSLVDAHVAKRYLVPLTPVPALIRDLSRDIAIHKLYERREVMPARRQKACENALKLLGEIASATLTLGVAPVPASSGSEKAARGGPAQV